jgi:hypothetical protein
MGFVGDERQEWRHRQRELKRLAERIKKPLTSKSLLPGVLGHSSSATDTNDDHNR